MAASEARVVDGNAMPQLEGRYLDLGCGERKHSADHVGVDLLDYPGVDIVGDVFDVLGAIPDGAIAGVYSSHLFEHIDDVPRLMTLLARVIEPGGTLEVITPHFSNPYYYSDPTHRSTFGLYTFSYWSLDNILRRDVPTHQGQLEFQLVGVELGFKSPPPFIVRYAVKRVAGVIINLTTWTKEFYEENLSQVFPCYELRFQLVRRSLAS